MTVLSSILIHWVGTHFEGPYALVHRSGWVRLDLVAVGQGYLTQVPRRPSIRVSRLTSWSLGRPTPQALTLSGRTRFITWRLIRSFLEDWRRGLGHFLNLRVCIAYGLVPDTHSTNTSDWMEHIDFTLFSPRPLGRDTLKPVVFSGTRIKSGVFSLGRNRLRLPDVSAGEA